MRNEFVQSQTGNESSDNGFNTGQLCQKCRKKHNCQYKNIMRMLFIFQFPEKPGGNSGNECKHNQGENSKRNYQSNPEFLIQTSLTIAHDYCQNDKYRSIG